MASASFLPADLDLGLYAGDDEYLVIEQWTDDAMTVPRDISGLTFTAQMRRKATSDDTDKVDLSVTKHQGTSSSDPTTITVKISKAITNNGWKTAVWDLQQIETLSGDISTLYAGKVSISKDVTR